MERKKGKYKMLTKALVKAIIQILIDNNVEPSVIEKIKNLIK